MKWLLAVVLVLLVSCSCRQCQSQDLGPFANIGNTLDATESQNFIKMIRGLKDMPDYGLVLGENVLKSVMAIDDIPQGTEETSIPGAVSNRIFNVNNPNSLVARLSFRSTYEQARLRQATTPQWVRNIGLLSATSELQNPTRTVFMRRVLDLTTDLPGR